MYIAFQSSSARLSGRRPSAPPSNAAKELEGALAIAQRSEAKEQLQKTKALMEGFAAAVEDLAKAQTTLLAQIEKRSVISEEWNKSVDTQMKLPAMQKLDNRLEIERLLFQADGKVNALRANAWKLGATGDASLVTEMTKVKHPMDAGQKGQKGIEW